MILIRRWYGLQIVWKMILKCEKKPCFFYNKAKASMWDSLESVWKTTDQDPDCDAYVIPIPYFDRTANGSFGDLY